MDTGVKIFRAVGMIISFRRHDSYPRADIEIELIASGRIPSMAAFFKISSTGDKTERELLRNHLEEWAARRRINLRSRCGTVYDTHQAYIRYWTHVSEFMTFWVGERIFSSMLEDASLREARHNAYLRELTKQIALGNAADSALEDRLAAAARAFLQKPASEPNG